MSGVFSIASHCALQYLPDFTVQLHGGCAHFFGFSGAMDSSTIQRRYREAALPRTKCRISKMKAKIKNKWIIAETT